MEYTSTRDHSVTISAAAAILQGISGEGGLFVPKENPQVTMDELEVLCRLDYCGRAERLLALFLTDFTPEEIHRCVEGAYRGSFEDDQVAPLVDLAPEEYLMELWHGPTCAFKDVALQLLPRLMGVSAQKVGDGKTAVILVATSGDTGKAALEGFKDVAGTKVLVFYPQDGVSRVQKLQMATQEGENLSVCAVKGNFDDCQSGVKTLLNDQALAQKLEQAGYRFSSANSINWGRLVPQIVYYFSAYCDLVAGEQIALGDLVNFAVPTGNFGDILAGWYAKQMGLPVGKLICASNENDVLTDFLHTGVYDKNRPFHLTTSPSMDILISSNLERLLFALCDGDGEPVRRWMTELRTEGCYTLPQPLLDRLQQDFYGGCCNMEQAAAVIADCQNRYSYLCDPHTAVALEVYHQYRRNTGDDTPTVVLSTASPYKFASSVLDALGDGEKTEDFASLRRLEERSGQSAPAQIMALEQKPVRFTEAADKEELAAVVEAFLGR